jgi:hypothetical protein
LLEKMQDPGPFEIRQAASDIFLGLPCIAERVILPGLLQPAIEVACNFNLVLIAGVTIYFAQKHVRHKRCDSFIQPEIRPTPAGQADAPPLVSQFVRQQPFFIRMTEELFPLVGRQ